MLVHRCDRCCVYKKEIQPCSPKYRGIWAICMNKMMFPFQRCNSVSKCSFREFRPFSVIAENHWPYYRIKTHPRCFQLIVDVFWVNFSESGSKVALFLERAIKALTLFWSPHSSE